jgi:hypothetical protein
MLFHMSLRINAVLVHFLKISEFLRLIIVVMKG